MQDREQLITEGMPVVGFVARRIAKRLPDHVEIEDLLGAGYIGLLDAADRFDPKQAIKFKTFCKRRIYGAIIDDLRTLDWAPRQLRAQARKVAEAVEGIESARWREATDEEVAAATGQTLQELRDLRTDVDRSRLLSQTPRENHVDGEDLDLIETAPCAAPDALRQMLDNEPLAWISEALPCLPPRQRLIIRLHYFEDTKFGDIATILGMSKGRVSQLHTDAIMRLKRGLRPVAAHFFHSIGQA